MSIESTLQTLSTKLLEELVSEEVIRGLPSLFDFTRTEPDLTRRVSKCFSDLQMLMIKLTSFIMKHFEIP